MTDQAPSDLFLSVITLGELTKGVARLDPGRRRERLTRWLAEDLPAQFAGRVLPFDQAAAVRWGEMMAEAELRGRPARRSIFRSRPRGRALGLGLVYAQRHRFRGPRTGDRQSMGDCMKRFDSPRSSAQSESR